MTKIMQEMSFPELPHYLKVKKVIDQEFDSVSVVVESSIHVNPEIEMPTTFSIGFVRSCPGRFRSDVLGFIIKRYGLKLESTRYS